jgi:hypothetical protein
MSRAFWELRKSFNLTFALGCLLCSVVVAQSVKTSYLPGTEFSKYHSYKWVEIKGRQHPDPNKDAQIKQFIDSQLASKSLAKMDDAADLSVDYQVAINKAEVWQVYEDWSSAALLDGRIPQRKKVTIDTGTLVVDIYDTAAKKLVWTGTAQKTLDPKSKPEQVQKAVQVLLNRFPPM